MLTHEQRVKRVLDHMQETHDDLMRITDYAKRVEEGIAAVRSIRECAGIMRRSADALEMAIFVERTDN